MVALVLFGTFFLLILLGVPIAFAIGSGALAGLVLVGSSPSTLVQQVLSILDSFPYLAIPFFLLAGAIMESGGVSYRLIRFANTLVGRYRGGLGLVSIVGTTIFSDVSGSKAADTAAIGSVTLPAMRRAGYPMDLATAFVAAGGAAAVLIPPCITMVIYGFITETSISALFVAGFLPGLVMSGATLVMAYVMSRYRKLPAEAAPTCGEMVAAFRGALLPLGMPVIILVGIVGGVFTITEAAVVAVVYGLIVTTVVTRELPLSKLPTLMFEASVMTGMVVVIAAVASQIQWVLTTQGIPLAMASWIKSHSDSPAVFLLLVNVVYLILGCLLDSSAALLLATPVLFPLARLFGIDPVQFGIILTANLGIGFVTPPVGISLFVACGISKVRLQDAVPPLLPFIGVMVVVLMLITYWPNFALFAPEALMGYVPR